MFPLYPLWGFPCGSASQESTCNAGNLGLIPGSGRSPGGGNGNPLQYFYLENLIDWGAWRAIVHRVKKSRTQLSNWAQGTLCIIFTTFLEIESDFEIKRCLLVQRKKKQVLAAWLCLTLCDSMDCSPPDSSVHGLFQARILEWVAVLFFRGTSWPRDQTQVSCIAGRFFTSWSTQGKPKILHMNVSSTKTGTLSILFPDILSFIPNF